MTQDIDVVISHSAASRQTEAMLAAFSNAGFLLDHDAARYAIENQRMFQLLDMVETLKIDVYPRELIPNELQRSVSKEIFPDVTLPVASLQDAVVSKLIWISKGSHKNRRDVRQLCRHANTDELRAIERLAVDLNLQELLQSVLTEPDEIE